jgi:hypothetical protein
VGTKVLGPLRVCVKVAKCCDPSSAGTLTFTRLIETWSALNPMGSGCLFTKVQKYCCHPSNPMGSGWLFTTVCAPSVVCSPTLVA